MPAGPAMPAGGTPAWQTERAVDERVERLAAALPWAKPGPALDARVAAALAQPQPSGYRLPWVSRWSAAAAVIALGLGVAVVAVVLTRSPGNGGPTLAGGGVSDEAARASKDGGVAATPEQALAQPPIEQLWVSTQPTGRIVLADGRAMEAVRVTAVRQVSFVDEAGVAYDVAEPMEQVMYVPASYE